MNKYVCFDETCQKRIRKPIKPTKWPIKWILTVAIGSGCLGGVATFGWSWLRTPYVLQDTQAQVEEAKRKISDTQSNVSDILVVLRDHGNALTNLAQNAQRQEQWQLSLTKTLNDLNVNVAHMQGTLEGIKDSKK